MIVEHLREAAAAMDGSEFGHSAWLFLHLDQCCLRFDIHTRSGGTCTSSPSYVILQITDQVFVLRDHHGCTIVLHLVYGCLSIRNLSQVPSH